MILDVEFIEDVQDFDVEFGENIENTTELEAQIKTLNAQIAELEQDVTEAFEEGKKAQYDEFWDGVQNYGKRTDFMYGFARWNVKEITPKYPLIVSRADNMFYNCLAEKIPDIDTSQCQRFSYMFCETIAEELPFIDISNATITTSLFYKAKAKKISLKCTESVVFSTSFERCEDIEELNITGTIGQNGLNLQWSTKLSHDSLMSIINALRDNSGTDTWNTITLGSENIAKLTAEELDIMENKQWQYS